MKKNRSGKFVGHGTNKVNKAHMSVVREKLSLKKDVLFEREHCRDACRTMKSSYGSCCDDEDSVSSDTLVLHSLSIGSGSTLGDVLKLMMTSEIVAIYWMRVSSLISIFM